MPDPTPYATAEEVQTILAGMDPTGFGAGASEVTEEEVTTASHDIDAALADRALPNADVFKILPTALEAGNQNRLKRAVAYQVAYRRRLGFDFFAGAEYAEVSAAGMSRKGTLPRLAPAARQLLADAGLLSTSTVLRDGDANWRTVGHQPLFPWLWRR